MDVGKRREHMYRTYGIRVTQEQLPRSGSFAEDRKVSRHKGETTKSKKNNLLKSCHKTSLKYHQIKLIKLFDAYN